MKFAKFAAAAAAVSLATAPAMAAPAAERTSAPATGESKVGGQAGILVIFALLAVVIGFVASDDNNSTSP